MRSIQSIISTTTVAAICICGGLTDRASAGGPGNDSCFNAFVIPGTGAPYNPSLLNTIGATEQLCEANASCDGSPDASSVWYRLTPTHSTTITVDTFGSNYDTILAIYDGCPSFDFNPGPLATEPSTVGGCILPTELACNDQAAGGNQSEIANFPVTEGETYFIRVSAWNGGDGGQLDFNVRSPQPANDFCGTPHYIASRQYTHINQTGPATVSFCDVDESCEFNNVGTSNSVWYGFIALEEGTLFLDTEGTDYDTVLSVFDGGCPFFLLADAGPEPTAPEPPPSPMLTAAEVEAASIAETGKHNQRTEPEVFPIEGGIGCFNNPVEVACDDDSGTGLQSALSFEVTPGVLYRIKVADYGTNPNGAGELHLNATFVEACPSDITPIAGNDTVNIDDLLKLLDEFGPCP